MFFARQPDPATVERVRAAARDFNYDARLGPRGFFRNRTEVVLGEGEAVWLAAVAALRSWRMGQLGWCDFLAPGGPAVGQVVVARASHWGFWSLHPSRIIAVVQTVREYSFTIRTLQGHDERGEERFAVERTGDEVRYQVRSYSRPARWLGWVALPYVRYLQGRFGRESARMMSSIVGISIRECQ
ncbi:MAG: DUF1990 domain-containing protein [Bryobacteraceae bacterium]|nr:DUF1990 domain-containing protein [Bryobacteraceae bacterium]